MNLQSSRYFNKKRFSLQQFTMLHDILHDLALSVSFSLQYALYRISGK